MNNNISEDYCSFEVSKLLEEKGFDIDSKSCYLEDGRYTTSPQHPDFHNLSITYAPTHSLAIKWIRENFGIHISVRLESYISDTEITWRYFIQGIKQVVLNNIKGQFNSLEEATEVALLYTLQNLIK